MKPWTRWTPADDAELTRLFHEGRKDSEIAYAMGCRRKEAIWRRRFILGLRSPNYKPQKQWTAAEDNRLRDLLDAGRTDAQCARIMGFHHLTIFRKRHLLNLPPSQPKIPRECKLPPEGTPERKRYNKLQQILGAERAYAEMSKP